MTGEPGRQFCLTRAALGGAGCKEATAEVKGVKRITRGKRVQFMNPGLIGLIGWILVAGADVSQAQFRWRTNNFTITIIGYTGTNGNVTVPDTINDLPVVSIGDNAFQYGYVLTNVTISSGVSYLGNLAFYNCTNLVGVTLPDTLGYIGFHAFDGCRSLTSVAIPWSVSVITNYTFYN